MAHGTCAACGREGRLKRGWCSRCYQRWRHHGDPLWEPPRRDPAKYDSTGHILHEKTCPKCGTTFMGRSDQTHCSYSCGAKGHRVTPRYGPDNHNWGGSDVGYFGIHGRVYKARGKADHCERCGATDPSLNYDWASLVDHPTSVDQFESMCRSCHRKFDRDRDRLRRGWQGPPSRKLSADDVREAKKRHAGGTPTEELAEEYGVHKETMRRAIAGVTWTWVS